MFCLNREEESTNEVGRMMKSGKVERRVQRDNNFNVDWVGKQCKVKSMEFALRKTQVFLSANSYASVPLHMNSLLDRSAGPTFLACIRMT